MPKNIRLRKFWSSAFPVRRIGFQRVWVEIRIIQVAQFLVPCPCIFTPLSQGRIKETLPLIPMSFQAETKARRILGGW
ncbi:MAG: hypothetical protein WCO56_06350, partial [Verrucomicrobiota bacterium]